MSHKISIELPDNVYLELQRIAKADYRNVTDLAYLLLAEGLEYFYMDCPVMVQKFDSEYTEQEKDQLKTKSDYVCKVISSSDITNKLADQIREISLNKEVV